MGLHQNGFRDNIGVFRYAGAGFSNGAYPSALYINTHLTGAQRNITAGEGITDDKVGVPLGYLNGGSWVMPQKAGNISARNTARIEIETAASILGGKALEGSAGFTIETNTPSGELIAFGIGSATIQLETNSPLLTASINGGGSASFEIATNIPVLGAEASIVGSTTITISIADASILPVNDDPVLREATASMSFSGTLTPYAIGQMAGSTDVTTELTAESITAAVWNAILADFNENGTAGKALALAGSGGVDYDSLAQAILAAAQSAPIHANVQKINDVEVTGAGVSGNEWGAP